MAKKLSINTLKRKANEFKQCRTIKDVSLLLETQPNTLQLIIANPMYYHFTVPKRKGGERHIEAPNYELKRLQRKLNVYLQASYYFLQPKSSYGYIIAPKGEKNPKNVLTNAKAHYGNNFLLNVDLKDFFHQIKQQKVYAIFKDFFEFDKTLASFLTRICIRNGRLPMGAPTSPALSNLSTITFDKMMTLWATENDFIYTRFVDDLSISSKTSFDPIAIKNKIQAICNDFELPLNESKTKFYNASQTKKVTGLIIDDPVSIPQEFYDELETDLLRLKHLNEVYQLTGEGTKNAMVKLFKQQVYGQINFIAQIEGYQSEEYLKYEAMFEKANTVSVEKLYARWTNFNYF